MKDNFQSPTRQRLQLLSPSLKPLKPQTTYATFNDKKGQDGMPASDQNDLWLHKEY